MRLPSFNDFSPGILGGDIRKCLSAVESFYGDDLKIIEEWARLFFDGKTNKRSSTNIPATLRSTGMLAASKPFTLTEAGRAVHRAPTPIDAAREFCRTQFKHGNAMAVVEAVLSLNKRGVAITKDSLKTELQRNGITSLSTATTDHSTLKNWLVTAGVFRESKGVLEIDDTVLRMITGVGSQEKSEFDALSPPQQVFLQTIRKLYLTEAGPFEVSHLLKSCLRDYPHLFNEAQFARLVRIPLVTGGWIEAEGQAKGPQGGRSGRVKACNKLLDIPLEIIVPRLEEAVPSDLKSKLDTQFSEIEKDLREVSTHKAGVALELLALRMLFDLDLQPRGFRVRSSATAHAEVDLTAEGAHLLFSRWTVQCKNVKAKVGLSEVAKEVGIAIYMKAHVVVMVTTSNFTDDAINYAKEITRATHLQFLFISGAVVDKYLKHGRAILWEHVIGNSRQVLEAKRIQPVDISDVPTV